MRYWKSMVITMFLVVASPAIAQQDAFESGTINEDIHELLVLTNSAKLGDQMLDQIFSAYERMVPDVPPEIWKKARESMRADDLVELVIPIYIKHFNREDIKGIITFYKTPIGKKLIEHQGAIMKESMAIGMAWGQEVSKKILDDLKSKGYKVPNTL
jgi:hypothetical protein